MTSEPAVTKQTQCAVMKAWAVAADPNDMLFVVTCGEGYMVEGPEEQVDGEEHEEALLRLFSEYDDAVLYCELQREDIGPALEGRKLNPEEHIQVAKVTLDSLYALLPVLQQRSIAEHDAPVRVDLCVWRNGNRLVSIDTVVSDHVTHH